MVDKLGELMKGKAPLQYDKNNELVSRDTLIAVSTLLLQVAQSDLSSDMLEQTIIAEMVENNFGLTKAECGDVFAVAKYLAKEQPNIDAFVTVVNDNFLPIQKVHLLAMVWKVVISDLKIKKEEIEFAAELAQRLEITIEQATEARDLAEQGKI